MSVAGILLSIYFAVCLAFWAMQARAAVLARRHVPVLGRVDAAEPDVWPRLSVIVPARNEADRIEPAARSLLASDYPLLEILFVDDRSTDGTAEIVDRLAAADPRVRAIHVTELPDGWLGKVHAMQTGLEAATGDMVLLTDADVHFSPQALRRAVTHVEAGQLDHLAAIPELTPSSLCADAMVSVFIRQFIAITRPWAVGDPASRAFLGIGAFNLVRRSALDDTAGLEWLRMEVGDDMGLGLLMKRAGKRSAAVSAFGDVRVKWIGSLKEAAASAEKGYATVCRFSLVRALLMSVVSLGLELSPLVAVLVAAWPGARPLGLAALAVPAVFLAMVVALRRWYPGPAAPLLIGPLAAPIGAAIMIRTAILGKLRRGATWRGTVYSEAELREGMRLRFP